LTRATSSESICVLGEHLRRRAELDPDFLDPGEELVVGIGEQRRLVLPPHGERLVARLHASREVTRGEALHRGDQAGDFVVDDLPHRARDLPQPPGDSVSQRQRDDDTQPERDDRRQDRDEACGVRIRDRRFLRGVGALANLIVERGEHRLAGR
jgi:hypothetical protein